MNRQRRMAGLIFILGLMLGFGIWQQRSQAAGQARQWLQHVAPTTGGNHVVGASAFGVSPAAAVAFAPTFAESGATLTLTLSAVNESVSVVSNGSSYTFTSNNLWSGTNSTNVTGNGTTTLTVTAAGLAAFSQIIIMDAAVAGTSVTFNNSGANAYTDNFNIVLDDPGAGTITFNGTTSFTGANTLSASTSRDILVNNGASVTTVNGDLTLLANQQATPTAANFYGVLVREAVVGATGVGNVTVKGKGLDAGVAVGVGGGGFGSSQITANGGAVLVEGTLGGVGSFGKYGVILLSGAVITNAGTGAGATVTVRGFASTLTGDLNVGVYLTTANAQITANGGAVLVEGTGGDGAGSGRIGVYLANGGIKNWGTGAGATVTVRGFGGNLTGTGDGSIGVALGSVSEITANGGAVLVEGTSGGAGTSSNSAGVSVASGVIRNLGTGAGATVTVRGFGGNLTGTGDNNSGVSVNGEFSEITANGGAVLVEGTGGGAGTSSNNAGVTVESGGVIKNGGTGAGATVTVRGFGGNLTGTGNSNSGVGVSGANTQITANGGAVLVEGTGGGAETSNFNYGVYVASGGVITNAGTGAGATVIVKGFGGNLTGTGILNPGVYVTSINSQITASGGAISVTGSSGANSSAIRFEIGGQVVGTTGTPTVTLSGDSMEFLSTSSINAGANPVMLKPRMAGTLINLGGADVLTGSPLTLGLTDAELDRVTAGTLTIGDNASGTITVSADLTRPTSTNIRLVSGGDVTLSGGQVNTGGGTLLLDPGVAPFAVKPTKALTDVTASTLSFGSDLAIAINGLTVDTQYTQLNVAGAVNLTGVDFVLSGAFVPALGNVFTIVAASNVTGIFNGLPNGSSFTFNGRTLQIAYTATTVTLTVVNTSPTITAGAALTRQRGSAGIVSTIATVNDNETAVGSLVVTATTVPAGLTVTGITNAAGTITANVAASCTAVIGANTVVLTVTDGNSGAATANLTVNVTANTAPSVTYAAASVNAGGSTSNSPTSATDNGSITGYSVQSQGTYTGTISVNASGVVSISNAAPTGAHTITIRATDNCGATTDSTFTLTVNCASITVTNPAITSGVAGVAFSQSFTQAGGAAPVSFSLASGTLPAGLSLATNGTLSGTPTQAGSFPLTVKATDGNNCTGTGASYNLVISCPTITVSPSNATLPTGRASTPYAQTFTQAGGSGAITWNVSAGALPAGLTLSTGGVLSGSPTVFGTFGFTVRATDANLCTGERAYTLLVNPPCGAITVNPTSLPNATQNTSYSQTLTATGGTSPYTFAVTAGALPNGLTLASGGALTGTPTTTGTFNFTVTATDNTGCTGTRAYAVSIAACSITLTPTGRNFSAAATNSTVGVTATSCAWTATSNAAWLTLTGTTSGSGNATVNYNVAVNTGASRTGVISVNGATHTVFQATADAAQDTDGDGIPDSVEIIEGRNPLVKDNDIFSNNATGYRLFVMQQYRDFLGREGDPGGITNWVNALNANVLTRAQVIESFFNSTEFQNTGAPIVRLYFAYFLRIPDYAGLQNWTNAYRAGMPLDTISNAFAGSAEFIQTYGNLNNTQFVTLVYNNVLGRAPDPTGLANWVNALNNGMSRGTMMLGFSESQEYKNRSGNWVYVTMMYVGMLRRSPEQAGFDNWVGYLNAGSSGLDLINGFIGAQEYHNRFLP